MWQEYTSREERVKQATRVTWLSVTINSILTIGKLLVGIFGHSAAMVADALHSGSDFATDFAVMLGMRLAKRPEDEDHPYGHGKYENLAAILVGIALCGAGFMIVIQAVAILLGALGGRLPERPALVAMLAGIISVIVKEWLYQRTVKVAEETANDALLANAWHHRSDAFSSFATSIGAGAGALLGGKWVLLDPVAACLVGCFLLRVAWAIVKDSLDKLMEHGMSVQENEQILALLHSLPNLSEPHHLRSRRVGAVAVIEMHFRVNPEMTVRVSHNIASRVEQRLREVFGADAIITIHVEPLKTYCEETPYNTQCHLTYPTLS